MKTFKGFALVLLLVSGYAFSQVPQPQYSYNVNVDTVKVDGQYVQMAATVTGSNNDGIRGLSQSSFLVRHERGNYGSISPILVPFEESEVGISVVLCLDASGSMRGTPLRNMQDAVCAFIDSLRPQDYISITAIGDDFQLITPFTNDRQFAKNAVRNIQANAQWSPIFYSVYKSLEQLETRGDALERRFIVVVSDGKEESTGAYALDDVVEKAREMNVSISTIGFTGVEQMYLQNLEAMADRTGGRYHFGGTEGADLFWQLQESVRLLRSQYLLTFQLPSPRESNDFILDVSSYNFAGSAPFSVSGMSQYECAVCGIIFNTAQERDQHLETHVGETFTCEHCGAQFTEYEAYETHLNAQHSFPCTYCDSILPSQAALDQHVSEVHPFVCTQCDSVFDSSEALEEHIQLTHAEEKAGIPWLYIIIAVFAVAVGAFFFINRKKQVEKKNAAIQAEIDEEERKRQSRVQPSTPQEKPVPPVPSQNSSTMTPPVDGIPESRTFQQSAPRKSEPVGRRTQIGSSMGSVFTSGKLIVQSGPNRGVEYDISKPQITVGRGANNTIVLDDDTVSRNHAIIRFAAGQFQLTDNNSSNGTSVNGSLIAEALLSDGDIITFGSTEMRFHGGM